MKWFTGDIGAAINLAKTRGAIFVVYCEGKDEISKQMTELINNDSITSKLESQSFVAIKVESDKEEYMQFAKIYQLVPVPSIFFIQNGIPIKIVTGTVKTVSELEDAIEAVIKIEPQSSSQASSAPKADSSEVVCEDEIFYKKPETASSNESTEKNETEDEKQQKIKKAMKLIEQQRIERIEEEKRLEKEKEIQRRKEGQQIIDAKKTKAELELKQIKDDQIKEKLQAKADRQRVLDQIQQDKKERAQRFASSSTPTDTKASPVTPPAVTTPTTPLSNTTRIQFKKPDGEAEIVTFDSDMLFADLHLFVKNDVLRGATKEFILATTFPRREFSHDDFDKTLADLSLTPSAVLLIIFGRKAPTSTSGPSTVLPTQTDGSLMTMLGTLVMQLFTPVMALFAYMKNYLTRQPEVGESANDVGKRKRNEDLLAPSEAAKKRNLAAFNNQAGTSNQSSSPTGTIPKSGAYKRQNPSSNVHRLHQNSDSEDEDKKTYNGNSTQQL